MLQQSMEQTSHFNVKFVMLIYAQGKGLGYLIASMKERSLSNVTFVMLNLHQKMA